MVVLDPDARAICDDAVELHPELRETVDLEPLGVDLAAGFDGIAGVVRDGRPWAVYLCLDASDGIRRASARVVQRRLSGSADGVVVIAVSAQDPEAGDASPPIREVDADDPEHGFDPSRFDRTEALARTIHGVYELHMRTTGEITAPALEPFDELPPVLQQSNRQQARNIRDQLASVLTTTAPLRDWATVRQFTAEEIEVLSELEHVRWCSGRFAEGWTYGAERSDAGRRHPDLIPWSELPEDRREISRVFMYERPWTLARVGEAIAPHPARGHLARLTHDVYRTVAAPSAPPWNELPDPERAATRAFVDAIPAKLLRVGRRIASTTRPLPPDELSDEEVELLARLEHERWAEFRGGEGWVRAGGTQIPHSGLLPWADLSEEWREVDRVLVRAIPRLVAEAGLAIMRINMPVGTVDGAMLMR